MIPVGWMIGLCGGFVLHNDALQNMADRVVKLRDGKIRKNFVNETKIPAAELEW